MSVPADVIAEMETLGIGKRASSRHDEESEGNGVNGSSARDPRREEVEKHRRTITEIAKMADKMSGLIQEIRNTSRETDDRLKQMETDLQILGLEE